MRPFRHSLLTLTIVAAMISSSLCASDAAEKPTIVLVHGAMESASVWNSVIEQLQSDGYSVLAPADPLRSLRGDADYLASLLATVAGPIVLVGHSYGGSVITQAASGNANIKSLVYVAAFAPDVGESSFDLVGKFPGSLLGAALATPVALADGANDLSVQPDKFQSAFAADLPIETSAVLAATQRPVTDVALTQPADSAAWKTIPSYFIYGAADMSIPPALHAFMAERAHAKDVVKVQGASHVVQVSHPNDVAKLIEEAAQ
jgi:pimeloyl-ACP methyl ester carboxylesterase